MKIIRTNPKVNLPTKATSGSAGFDLQAAIESEIEILPMQSILIPTGLKIYIEDPNLVGCVFPRSKAGAKLGIVLGNLTGIIDSDYQGEWFVSILNRNLDKPVTIKPYESIAQVVFFNLPQVTFEEVESFDVVTERNDGGISKDVDTKG